MDGFLSVTNSNCKNPRETLYFVLNLTFCSFYFGYVFCVFSSIDIGVLLRIYNITLDPSLAQGLLQGLAPVGGIFGSMSTSVVLRYFSRRNSILFLNAVAFALGLALYYPNYQVLFTVRFFQGMIMGIFSGLTPTIVQQYSPAELMNAMTSINSPVIVVGIFSVYFFQLIFSGITGDPTGAAFWWLMYLIPLLTIALQTFFILTIFTRQTPKYLIEEGKLEQFQEFLEHVYKPDCIAEVKDQYMRNIKGAHSLITEELDKSTPKMAIIFCFYYAIMAPLVGPNVAISYGGDIMSKVAPSLKEIMPALLMLEFFFANCLCGKLLNKYGRKQIAIGGSISVTICLAIVAIGYFIPQEALSQLVIVVGLLLFVLTFGCTHSPMTWIYIPSVLPPHQVGYAIMFNWLGASTVLFSFPLVIEAIPSHNAGYVFIFFSLFALASIFIIKGFMVQTKGRSEVDILEEYRLFDEKYLGTSKADTELGTELMEKNR